MRGSSLDLDVHPLKSEGSPILETLSPHRSRLLLKPASFASLAGDIDRDPLRKRLAGHLHRQAEELASRDPLANVRDGGRLIEVSRDALYRILLWALLARAWSRADYARRAEQEMVALAAFADWNPTTFLDTAEMMAALAIGYDWLYDDLRLANRVAIRDAIVEKGIRPSFLPVEMDGSDVGKIKPGRPGWWVNGTSNWTQVCHGGIVLGALAVAEDIPVLAALAVRRALKNVAPLASQYEPSGVYPEGPGYWSYGTTYHVLLIAALRSALGNDFGLGECPGLHKSLLYMTHLEGPSGDYFNYADNRARLAVEPAFFWLAAESPWPGIAHLHRDKLEVDMARSEAEGRLYRAGSFDALMLAWSARPPQPGSGGGMSRSWLGQSVRPVAVHRTAWNDPEAVFAGIKGGMPDGCHGHMDEGTFVLEADGVRWADDLGQPLYLHYEKQGIDIWGLHAKDNRWTVLANGPLVHNIALVGASFQELRGMAPIVRFSEAEAHAVVDLTASYAGRAARVLRGLSLRPDRRVVVQDEVEGAAPGTGVRWAIVTRAEIDLEENAARLRLQGRTLRLFFEAGVPLQMEIVEVDALRAPYDLAYPGWRLLVVRLAAPADGCVRFRAIFRPDSATADDPIPLIPCGEWSGCV